jgi:hypothetical protein
LFHLIDRKTHHRVHHQNVDERGEVAKPGIAKGYKYAKNKAQGADDFGKSLASQKNRDLLVGHIHGVEELLSKFKRFARPIFQFRKSRTLQRVLDIAQLPINRGLGFVSVMPSGYHCYDIGKTF